jgi:serine protease
MGFRSGILGTFFLSSFLSVATTTGLAADPSEKRVIVRYEPGAEHAVAMAVTELGAQIHRRLERHRLLAVSLQDNALNGMRKRKDVQLVEEDPKRYLQAQQVPYGVDLIEAGVGGLTAYSGHSRKVCIMDTGYDLGHQDLPSDGALVGGDDGYSQGCGGAGCDTGLWHEDGHGHGTHVSGTVAALDNDVGVVGVVSDASLPIHMVKVFNNQGDWAYGTDLIAAIDQCVDAEAQIISMSLGGSGSSEAERGAFSDAYYGTGPYEGRTNGMLSIAAAGNSSSASLSYPASYETVMSVAAIDQSSRVAVFSQYNSQVEIAAPGVGVMSTLPGDLYAAWDGTSMATPHISGAAALIWSHHEACTNIEIRAAMISGATDLGGPGRDSSYGHGLISAGKSELLLAESANCDTPPLIGLVADQVENGVPQSIPSGNRGDEFQFSIEVPPGATDLQIQMSGTGGDADLYVRYGDAPAPDAWDCRPYINGNSETCVEPSPASGTWSFMARGYSDFSGLTLQANFIEPESDQTPIYFYPDADIYVHGSVSGSYASLAYNDGDLLVLQEVVSEGKRKNQTSQAEHKWRFSGVTPGASTTLTLVAAGEDRGDGDNFTFAISYDDGAAWSDLITLPLGGALKTYNFALAGITAGDVLVRVRDTNRTPRNLALERLWVDQLQIVTLLNTAGEVAPAVPSDFQATPEGGGVSLAWKDNSEDEMGFELHRQAESGNNWGESLLITRTGSNNVSWRDDTVTPGTRYRYQLSAFNATQNSPSVFAEVNTPGGIFLEGVGEKRKGVIFVALTWSGSGSDVQIHRSVDGAPATTLDPDPESGNSYLDDTGLKGGHDLEYRICETATGSCSNQVTISY